MSVNTSVQIAKDTANRKITVTRYFDGSVDHVWRAWTESDLLDQWWAPKPYRAETKEMNFAEGGHWLYAMVGPDNFYQWCKAEFSEIRPKKSFRAVDMFCDDKGNIDTSFPTMKWNNNFIPEGSGTSVVVEITFDKEADLQRIVEMGFEEGFTAALGNLDELLTKQP